MAAIDEQTPVHQVTFGQDTHQPQSRDVSTALGNGWVVARRSRIPSRAWNRQSILIFADFNDFESPRGSLSQRAAEQDDEVEEEYNHNSSSRRVDVSSSASSLYSLDKTLPEPPYHVFTLEKKKQLVYIVSLAGLFSPLSSNIYFPALGQIATVCLVDYRY